MATNRPSLSRASSSRRISTSTLPAIVEDPFFTHPNLPLPPLDFQCAGVPFDHRDSLAYLYPSYLSRNPSPGSGLPSGAVSRESVSSVGIPRGNWNSMDSLHAIRKETRSINEKETASRIDEYSLGDKGFHSPPAYSFYGDVGRASGMGNQGEGSAAGGRGWKDNRQIAKRGGWKRLGLIIITLILIIVGLVVGLVVGLNNRSKSTRDATNNQVDNVGNNSTSTGGASGSLNQPAKPNDKTIFPAGTWSIPTYLVRTTRNCTSNAATWKCYPYSLYTVSSPSSSLATFDWVISPPSPTNANHTISSTPNPFAIQFENAALSLRNASSPTEHYYFLTQTRKAVKPSVALSASGTAATCYFNTTMLEGVLYTRLKSTVPVVEPAPANASDAATAYEDWPYAVTVRQYVAAAADTPVCVDGKGASLGDFSVASGAAEGSGECECAYGNLGP